MTSPNELMVTGTAEQGCTRSWFRGDERALEQNRGQSLGILTQTEWLPMCRGVFDVSLRRGSFETSVQEVLPATSTRLCHLHPSCINVKMGLRARAPVRTCLLAELCATPPVAPLSLSRPRRLGY